MYEELVARLRRYTENCVAYKLDADFADAVQKAADAIEELVGKTDRMRWISVEERLPEEKTWVLCKCLGSQYEVMRLEYGAWYHDCRNVYLPEFVTHWMPLPAPPK